MEKLSDGSIVLHESDLAGVRALILSKKRACVDIHAPTESDIDKFVRAWEETTGDEFSIKL